jgi:tetratricopeptide (TPR) repeat protein
LEENRIVYWSDESIRWVLIFIVFSLPLAMSLRAFDAFDLTKATLLYLLSLYLFLAYLVRTVFSGRLKTARSSSLLPIISLVFVASLSTVFAPVPLASIVGEYGRYETYLAYLCFAFTFYLALVYFDDKKWIKRALWALGISAFFIALYAVLQAFSLTKDPLLPRFMVRPEQFGEARARSTLGNAVFLGGYIALATPLILLAFFEFVAPTHLIFGFILPIVVAAGLFSKSRGGWLGLAAGLVFLICWKLFYYFKLPEGKKLWQRDTPRWAFVIIGLLVLLTVFIYVAGQGNLQQKLIDFKKRFESAFVFTKGTTATRFEIWKGCFKMINDRPLVGFGLDQMLYQFPRYRSYRYTQLEGEMTMPDRAHNEYIQVGVNLGILGWLAFLWWLLTIGMAVAPRLKDGNQLLLGFTAALVGYGAQALTSITIVGMAPVVGIFLAISLILAGEVKHFELTSEGLEKLKNGSFAITAVTLILVLVLAFYAIRPVVADYYFYSANALAASGNWSIQEIENYYRRAVAWHPYRENYRNVLFDLYFDQATSVKSMNYLLPAIQILEEYFHYNPYFQDTAARLGQAYQFAYELTGDARYLEMAEARLRRATENDPLFRLARYGLIQVLLKEHRPDKALKEIEAASKIWRGDPMLFYLKGRAYAGLNRLEEAKQYYLKALQLNPGFQDAREALNKLETQALP